MLALAGIFGFLWVIRLSVSGAALAGMFCSLSGQSYFPRLGFRVNYNGLPVLVGGAPFSPPRENNLLAFHQLQWLIQLLYPGSIHHNLLPIPPLGVVISVPDAVSAPW